MSLRRRSYDVGVMLGALRVPYNITSIIKNITTQYVIEEFGTIVSVINANDYSRVKEQLETTFKGFRYIFVSVADNLEKKRYEIIWELMRSGYMKWLRHLYSSQFAVILETGNLSNFIIDERLRIWDNKPMYRYLIEDNLNAKEESLKRVLSKDPSFFDYMPEVFSL